MVVAAPSFQAQEVSLSGGKLRYHVAGEGRPVLYLHSAGGVRLSPALETLAQTFRIYVPTLPGFDGTPRFTGVSSMPQLAEVAHEFGTAAVGDHCDVIGHSFGGWLAAWLAVLQPELVGQLVLEAAAGFRPEGAGGLGGTPEELRRRMFAHPERLTDEKPPDVQAANRALVEHYHGPTATDQQLLARLPEIQCLTLIVQGTEDGVVPPESARLLKKHIPASFLSYVFDAAHGIEVDQPDRFAALVREFLERGPAMIINWKDQPPSD